MKNDSIAKLKTAMASKEYFRNQIYSMVAQQRSVGLLSDENCVDSSEIKPETLAKALEDPNARQMEEGWGKSDDRFTAPKENKLGYFLGDLSVLMHYAREAIQPVLKNLENLSETDVSAKVREKIEFLMENLQLKIKPSKTDS